MIDIRNQLDAIRREVTEQQTDDGEAVSVLLRRAYDSPIEDVWDAVTDPDRIARWLYPVSGELKVGGTFQLEGNAGGEILGCEPPTLLKVTFGGPTSIVELRLSEDDGGDALLELEHTVPIEMAGSGAGALFVGPGWDGALMSLGLYLQGEVADDPVAAANSPEAREFSKQSVDVWTKVVETSGTADDGQVAAAREMSLAQFAPEEKTAD